LTANDSGRGPTDLNDETQYGIDALSNRHWADLLRPLFGTEGEERPERGRKVTAFGTALRAIDKRHLAESEYAFNAADGALLIRIAASGRLARTRTGSAGRYLLRFLEDFRHPGFIQAIGDSYADCPDELRRDMIMLLAAQEPAGAAECLGEILRADRLPDGNYSRTFWHLSRSTGYLHRYVVAWIESVNRDVGEVVNLVNRALDSGDIDTQALQPVTATCEAALRSRISAAREAEKSMRGRWRVDEDYFYLRQELAAWLDLFSRVSDDADALLAEAENLEDPLVNLHAIGALIRRGHEPTPEAIERAAASNETRRALFRLLESNDRVTLMPASERSFDALAKAEMVEWLLFPSELGYEPPAIELNAMIEAPGETDAEDARRWCLWRFENLDRTAFAGITGPSGREAWERPSPATVRGGDAFSSFNEFDSMTVEEHFRDVVSTLSAWRLCDDE